MADQQTVGAFAEVVRFFLAYEALTRHLDQSLAESQESEATIENLSALTDHVDSANVIVRRVATNLDAGINSILRETFDKAKVRNRTLLDTALRGNPITDWDRRVKFLVSQLPRLKSHGPSVKDTFGEDAAMMRGIIDAAEIDNPTSRIYSLAEIRLMDSTLTRLKKWVEEASDLLGNPVSQVDQLATDMVAADQVAMKILKAQAAALASDPNDPDAVEAKNEVAIHKANLDKIAAQSNDPQAVIAHAASKLADSKGGASSQIGKMLKNTPEQDDAMTVRGKAVIAAGAGSGKTRVLAGKVLYHVSELNTPITSVMAVSFTRKSSAELQKRIIDYAEKAGIMLPDEKDREAYAGIGTTHSIGRGILQKSGRGYRVSTDPKSDDAPITGGTQSNLVRVAMQQVKMRGTGAMPLPEDMSFFPTVNKNGPPSVTPDDPAVENKSPTTNPSGGSTALDYYFGDPKRYANLMSDVLSTFADFLKTSFAVTTGMNQRGGYWLRVGGSAVNRFGDEIEAVPLPGGRLRWTPPRDNYTGAYFANSSSPWDVNSARAALESYFGFPQARKAQAALMPLAGADPATLSPEDKDLITDVVTNPTIQEGLRARGVQMKTAAGDEDLPEIEDEGIAAASRAKANRALENTQGPFYFYMKNPANQWFNIGASEADFTVGEGNKKKKLAPADFLQYLGLKKNSLVAPGQAFVASSGTGGFGMGDDDEGDSLVTGVDPEKERIFAAVYGAYEWLKRNIPDFRGRVDYDDQLILSSKELIENPSLLRRYQKQYKCILVDEAQDLNKAQHVMFGLVAGYLDPATLQSRADDKMSADTFALIGDDKQAIYGFRGADPDEFIDKSDLVPGGKGFKTKLLDTNFRSGSNIVDAANKLITYNTKQIPMVCKTDPNKGEGNISRISVEDSGEIGTLVADQIESAYNEAKADGKTKGFFKSYGIAVRTNREVYGYVMSLIERGIPFRSKKNPLKGPIVKPVVALFALNSASLKDRNQAVLDGVKCPDFGINGQTMGKKLLDAGFTDFYDALVNGRGANAVYRGGSYLDRLRSYIDYMVQVKEMLGTASANEVMSFILSFKSPDDTTFIDSICADAANDAELMEEVQAIANQDNDGVITPEMIRKAAIAPLEPLRKAAGRFPAATGFSDYIASLNAANDRTEKDDSDVKADAVQIDTVHGWKGLETDNLILAMWQGGFPHARSVGDEKVMEQERRLAYVALTRGKNNVQIYEPKIVNGKPVGPSQFVGEACIPLMGGADGEPVAAPEAGDDSVAKTASRRRADCHIPLRYDPEYGSDPSSFTEVGSMEEAQSLEQMWPDYMVGSEEA
jgi:superfamily I DNA/RNA helicase